MKHIYSSNFPNHKNLIDMLVQNYNTFFGTKIDCLRLSCLNYKLGKDILPFENLCCFCILLSYRSCRLFSPASKYQNRIKSNHSEAKEQCLAHLLVQCFRIRMNGKPSSILSSTNLDPQLLKIQVEEVT